MTPLVLVGAGGFARETASLVRDVNRVRPSYELLGFVDDDPSTHGTVRNGLPVIGPLGWIRDRHDVRVVVCLGSPRATAIRRRVVARLELPEGRYATLVHPSAVLGGGVTVGAGTVVHAMTVCTCDVTIGRHVEIMPGVVLTHDDVVGDGVTFGAGARLAGGVQIGDDAYLGSASTVREGVRIGAGALVGMGAVVTRDVPAHQTWVGVPARPLGERWSQGRYEDEVAV